MWTGKGKYVIIVVRPRRGMPQIKPLFKTAILTTCCVTCNSILSVFVKDLIISIMKIQGEELLAAPILYISVSFFFLKANLSL